jgi:Spy/CpxP family protein refolding chaperone
MKRVSLLFAAGLFAFAACSNESTSPSTLADANVEGIDLVQDMGMSASSVTDRAGIGGSELPDSIKLTADQKAEIAALHEAYKAATAADLAFVLGIEAELKAARAAGKTKAEMAAILAKAAPYLGRLRAAFAKLQADIWKVYTPAQRAWIASRNPAVCRNDAPPLTEAQVTAIRQLKVAFELSIKDELALVKAIHEEARAAKAAGKSAAEIKKILDKAEAPLQAIRQAELRLKAAINELLTPAQRENPCTLRGLNG